MGKRGGKRIALILTILVLILIISFFIDKQIISLIQNIRNPILDSFFSWINSFEKIYFFYPFIFLMPILLLAFKRRKYIKPFTLSFFVSFILVFLVKIFTSRQRPIPQAIDFGFGKSLSSFPSGHSSIVFTTVPFIEYKLFKWFSILWFILACIFSLTRVWFGLHYLSDIIGGAIIGYSVSIIIKTAWKKLKRSKTKKKKKKKAKKTKLKRKKKR